MGGGREEGRVAFWVLGGSVFDSNVLCVCVCVCVPAHLCIAVNADAGVGVCVCVSELYAPTHKYRQGDPKPRKKVKKITPRARSSRTGSLKGGS